MRLVSDYPNSELWYVEDNGQRTLLSEFCRRAREDAGLTRAGLEMRCGLAYRSVSNYENGKYLSPRSMLVALDALGYGIEVKELKRGDRM